MILSLVLDIPTEAAIVATFGWPSLVRVTVGRPEENEYFVGEMEKMMADC